MPHQELPPTYAVLKVHQKFFLLRKCSALESSMIHCYLIDEDHIPPAIGPFLRLKNKETGGYTCWADGVQVCHQPAEQDAFIDQWERLAAQQEVYPERNWWYRDEIERMTGEVPYTLQLDTIACASTYVTFEGKRYLISDEGWTVGEALGALCEQVYAMMTTLGVTQENINRASLSL